MKARTCFVNIPEYISNDPGVYPSWDAGLYPGKYTMYYYGPSQANPRETIVETLKGVLTTVPKEWVKLI